MNSQQQVKLNLNQMEHLTCPCGGEFFAPVFLILRDRLDRRIVASVAASDHFRCVVCGKVQSVDDLKEKA